MKEFLITPLEMLTESSASVNSTAVIIYSYLFYLCTKTEDRSTDIKNTELSKNLNYNHNTVKTAVKVLKEFKFITVSGNTKNRKIRCNDPYDISKNLHLTKTSEKKHSLSKQKDELEKLRLEKWYIEYMEDLPIVQRVDDIKLYFGNSYRKLSVIDRYKGEKSGDPKDFNKLNLQKFRVFIRNRVKLLREKERIIHRAAQYDKQHKGSFTSELRKFYFDNIKNKNLSKYVGKTYPDLSGCPYEMRKMFLEWLEPELF
jgi:hypothetical protein